MLESDYAEILGKLSDIEKDRLRTFLQNKEVDKYLRKNLTYKAVSLELSLCNLTLFNIGCLESLRELLQINSTSIAA
jgi:hypothetical protein